MVHSAGTQVHSTGTQVHSASTPCMHKITISLIMAGIYQRNGQWYAVWNQAGKKHRKATGIPVHPTDMTAKKAETLARQQADIMEQAAKGTAPADKLIEATRQAAELSGMGAPIPTVREYLTSIPPATSASSERNRQRSYTLFLDYLGAAADKRIDLINYETCRAFIREQLKQVSQKTATQYRTYIAAAFSRAQDIDGFTTRNPMKPVSVPQEAASINPDKGADKQKREPFTLEEIAHMIHNFPAPWCHIVAFSWYTGGLRLSDVCQMQWKNIDTTANVYKLTEQKTKHVRELPIIPEMQALLSQIRANQPLHEPYIFPTLAHLYLSGAQANISTQFTTLLKGSGIIPLLPTTPSEGRRKNLSAKSFHSIRHTVVSALRNNPQFTADMVRDAVGHDSEEVERGYYTGTVTQKKTIYQTLADSITPSTTAKGYTA